jgi:6-phosphofructokinase 2
MTDILTLTMNPALDLYTGTSKVEPTRKVRCGPPVLHPGGGGINVARVAHRLGGAVLALYPAGGVTGRLLTDLLRAEQLQAECLPIAGETRQSFSVHEQTSGLDWRFVLPGPELSQVEWQACLERAVQAAAGIRLVVASGSLPPGVPADFFAQFARRLASVGVPLVLDTAGPALAAALQAGVHLIKPSHDELRELTGLPLEDIAQRVAACQAIIRAGQAAVVALSLGAQGAMLVSADGAWQSPALSVQVESTIGAGDSFVGGLVWALARGAPPHEAFAHAMAASAAALLSAGTALCRPEDVARLLPQVIVRRI